MADRQYYVRCKTGCLAEALTKEETLAAIAQAIETGEIKNVDTGFITTLKEQNKAQGLRFWVGTTAEYNALTTKTDSCFYIITDDTSEEDLTATLEEIFNALDDKASKGYAEACAKDYTDEQITRVDNDIAGVVNWAENYIDERTGNINATLPKMATGSYEGDGKTGAMYLNRVEVEFEPSVMFIFGGSLADTVVLDLKENYTEVKLDLMTSGVIAHQVLELKDNEGNIESYMIEWHDSGERKVIGLRRNTENNNVEGLKINVLNDPNPAYAEIVQCNEIEVEYSYLILGFNKISQ